MISRTFKDHNPIYWKPSGWVQIIQPLFFVLAINELIAAPYQSQETQDIVLTQ